MALLAFPKKPLEFGKRLMVEETLENPIGLHMIARSAAEWVPKVQDKTTVICRGLSNLSGKKTELMVMR